MIAKGGKFTNYFEKQTFFLQEKDASPIDYQAPSKRVHIKSPVSHAFSTHRLHCCEV